MGLKKVVMMMILYFIFNKQRFCYSEFRESFIPAFCVTVYKYEGGTINKHYNIYDVNGMDKKQFYTALSRTTKLEYIHLNNKKLKIKYTKAPYIKMETVNSYFNDDYSSGQIYQIIFEHNDKVYVGCSIRNLQTRLQEHITDKKSPVYKYKDDNLTIIPIIRAPCKDRKELNKVEAEQIIYYSKLYGDRLQAISALKHKQNT